RTVKLPDLRQIVSGDRYVWSDGVYNYSQDVKVALAAAGIKVEDECCSK
ncbi:ead/Ea22-like family protein, partial [Klebsiella pneumoniae]|nr:ead/Ea22-like family protein [Klebsiella pneumoniae]